MKKFFQGTFSSALIAFGLTTGLPAVITIGAVSLVLIAIEAARS